MRFKARCIFAARLPSNRPGYRPSAQPCVNSLHPCSVKHRERLNPGSTIPTDRFTATSTALSVRDRGFSLQYPSSIQTITTNSNSLPSSCSKGKRSWLLPTIPVLYPNNHDKFKLFAKFLLEGK